MAIRLMRDSTAKRLTSQLKDVRESPQELSKDRSKYTIPTCPRSPVPAALPGSTSAASRSGSSGATPGGRRARPRAAPAGTERG